MLKHGAQCSRPYLFGRLSGRAVAVLRWERNLRFIHGYYDVPFAGNYFLEIIVIYCNFDPAQAILEEDRVMSQECLVPGEKHRITMPETEIHAERFSELRGYWSSPIYQPLYTRFQPQGCRYAASETPHCHTSMDINRFLSYGHFITRNKNLQKKIESADMKYYSTLVERPPHENCYTEHHYGSLRGKEKCRVCTVGASHSKQLAWFLHEAVGVSSVGHVLARFPREVKLGMMEGIAEACQTVVVGFGQHDAKNAPLKGVHGFVMELEEILGVLKELMGIGRVFVRSVHYNSLGDEKLICPPMDNRNPAYIDQYNIAISELCERLDVPWIDTRWIDRPLWDSAPDWNHMHTWLEVIQAFYVAVYLNLI